MLRQLCDYAKQLLALKRQTEQNAADIDRLRQEVRELTAVVQRLVYEMQRDRGNTASTLEKSGLRLDNPLLRFEKHVPLDESESVRLKRF
jgi:hypothetical protein